mmetsp:Transcript_56091/g.131129  ORF Transcript_56091/g.131129 Transcript_56091/m.131129 type:complete len:241 (+) Transcript_56091:114-836(+)
MLGPCKPAGDGALFKVSKGPKVLSEGESGAGDLDRPRRLSTGPSMPLLAVGEGPLEGPDPLLSSLPSGTGDCDLPRKLSTGPSRLLLGGGALFSVSIGRVSGAGDLDRPRRLSTGPSMLGLSPDGEGPRPRESGGVGPCLSLEPKPLPVVSGAGDCDRPSDLSLGGTRDSLLKLLPAEFGRLCPGIFTAMPPTISELPSSVVLADIADCGRLSLPKPIFCASLMTAVGLFPWSLSSMSSS